MVENFISNSKKFFTKPQFSILSAAWTIMVLVIASRILGLIRQRILAHFFLPSELSLFFAAFRLPDLIFEVFVFGTFSSAFIPVFTKALNKGRKEAWEVASSVTNIGLIIFLIVGALIFIFAGHFYNFLAPGFSPAETQKIAFLTRVLFVAQGIFIISYVLTAVLESLRLFLVPALAPLFYNLGIIGGTYFLAPRLGLLGPAIGVLIGACLHLLIQLPLALKMGFKFKLGIRLTAGVKKIGRLALPRLIEVSFLQVSKTVELFLASLISASSYTYFTFGNSLQALPIGLFGTSIAKAALPTLSRLAGSINSFKKVLFTSLYQIVFLVLPIAAILIVLRIPLVRLLFGTDIFKWGDTLETGWVVSAFALGVAFQSASAVLVRGFYALHDTKTPVTISVITIILVIVSDFVLIKYFGLPVWGLALSSSLGSLLSFIILYKSMLSKLEVENFWESLKPVFKSLLASFVSGIVMYFLLKIFDRSVWVKRLSFLSGIEATKYIPFERFVLDTRYTINLLILTGLVCLAGIVVYIVTSIVLKSREIWYFADLIKKILANRKILKIPPQEPEVLT